MFTLYRIPYLFDYINRPGRLLDIWTLRVGAYSRWALIKFSSFSASVVCLFCNKTINGNNKTRRCNKARFLLASPQTSFGIPDERTPKDVCRVKKNSGDDSRTGRWLSWSLMLWWSKTLLFSSVLYSSGRSHSNFLNIQLCSFEKLWRPNLFWT